MNDNWWIFCIALIYDITPEEAEDIFYDGFKGTEMILRLRDMGYTLWRIAILYGTTYHGIRSRIRYYNLQLTKGTK